MLTLPNLDDKPYDRLLGEALAAIPMVSAQWTDLNPQDTGLMLLELCAAMTEMQIYYLDQVGERYLEQYLDLVLGAALPGEGCGARIQRFSKRCAEVNRIVTAGDLETLAMGLPFGLSQVHAARVGHVYRLSVFRRGEPLGDKELAQLRAALEPSRLLGTRIEIVQTVCEALDIRCKAVVNPAKGRTDFCRVRLTEAIQRVLKETEPFAPLNLGKLRSELLALPEVVEIPSLQWTSTGPGFLETATAGRFLSLSRADIDIVTCGGEGD